MNMFKKVLASSAIAIAALGLTSAASVAYADGERFVLVSHAPDSDSWWNTIKNGQHLLVSR